MPPRPPDARCARATTDRPVGFGRLVAVLATLAAGLSLAQLGAYALDAGDAWRVTDVGAAAYTRPTLALDAAQRADYADGEKAFATVWTLPPNVRQPWGLGPVGNAASCLECHPGKGRAAPQETHDRLLGMVVKLSLPGTDEHGAPRPHPAYGDQLNDLAVPGVPPEGHATLTWSETTVAFADGTTASLRAPQVGFRQLRFGPLGPETLTSARAAPAVFGVGLLDAIPEADLDAAVQRQAALGLNGRRNRVWSVQRHALTGGRFGLKANQPDLVQQVLAAFHGDIGVTSTTFPEQNCMPVQEACRNTPLILQPELTPVLYRDVMHYLRAGAAPARRRAEGPVLRRGEALFARTGCADCHQPEQKTGDLADFPALARVRFAPYTDLLLHDMGPGLADGRPDFDASGSDWRTAPLWGIGLAATVTPGAGYLHDGRARTLTEAILWHGGEGERAREAFRMMDRTDRVALLAFLGSL